MIPHFMLSPLSVFFLAASAAWFMVAPAGALSAVKGQTIDYKDGDTALKGYLAYDDVKPGPQPGVLVVPEWWGLNDYTRRRAGLLAELGYTAFVADMYGQGQNTDDPKQAGAWSSAISKDKAALRRRAQAALSILAAQPTTDKKCLAAIGYCFGGSTVLELAREGGDLAAAQTPLLGVVSFHGGLSAFKDADFSKMKAKVLILNGAADTFVKPEDLQACSDGLSKAGVDFQIVNYGHAVHAFTNPDSDSHHMANIAYNAPADLRSWKAMMDFFEEIFAPVKSQQ
jgi:dienelactone hydrolase